MGRTRIKKQKDRQEDLTGRRYGHLTVIERAQGRNTRRTYWRCRCDCGTETVVDAGHLKDGHTKSCGCYRRNAPKERRLDITGQRFGRLVAISPVETDPDTNWRCRCDCGKEVVCAKESLLSGNTKSCGCLRDETRKENIKKAIHFVDGTCIERIASRKNCSNNTSGRRGVCRRGDNKWRAYIGFQGKLYHLGTFSNFEDAVNARLEAEKNMYDAFLDKQ